MAGYCFRIFAVASIYLAVHFIVYLLLPSPINAEYWVRELIVVKQRLSDSISSPQRIIFLGGSSALFGIDAQKIAAKTDLPSINMGLHAGMRLQQVLSVGEDVVRQGDIVVLILEVPYYSCGQAAWDNWQLRNALAWDRSYFNNLSLGTRIKAILDGGRPSLIFDILASKLGSIVAPRNYVGRLEALAPTDSIWARYRSGNLRTSNFKFSAYNIDDRGDMLENKGEKYSGSGVPANEPGNICSDILPVFTSFVTRMKNKDVRVLVAHTPYLIDGTPSPGWREAEKTFLQDVSSTGAEVLDLREELFFPRAYFFDTPYHLNDQGRREWTKTVIVNLKKLGIGR